jgi:hypothetical protein
MTGGCLCGAVRFAIEPPSLFCCHCHCAWCRRAHGAAFVTWLGAAEERFRLTGDAPRWYRSSPQSERGFCPICGTTLFFRSALAPGEVHVARATLDGPADREPSSHVFFDAHVPWATPGDALPRYDGTHPGLRKYAVVPPIEER